MALSPREQALEIAAYLDRVKAALEEEIRAYPTPIPRCDAQFNHLCAERARLADLLERLRAASSREDLAKALADFADGAAFGEDAEERPLKECCSAALASLRPRPG